MEIFYRYNQETGSLLDFIASRYDRCFCIIPNLHCRGLVLSEFQRYPEVRLTRRDTINFRVLPSGKTIWFIPEDMLKDGYFWRGYPFETTCIWTFTEWVF